MIHGKIPSPRSRLNVVTVTFLVALCVCAGRRVRAAPEEAREGWNTVISEVAPSIVSIFFESNRSFDTDTRAPGQATGFVVDAERGIILTNRHVVQEGPVTARALFRSREEVSLTPLYRDPVHDFGFFQYDPSKLRYVKPRGLPLNPAGAQVGAEVRVIGNDAGEQLSILAGTISRLDREAPTYGFGNYNDFNTFYIQAATNTSGGSSGSPVIDGAGAVVALNAGGRRDAATSYYLPLGRIQRALSLVQAGKAVPRGDLLVEFVHRPFDQVLKLGLSLEMHERIRAERPDNLGLLVVQRALAGSSRLQAGDIVYSLNGRLVVSHEEVESVLDGQVGKSVTLEVVRDGRLQTVVATVYDLHAVTPSSYIELSDGVLHDLSYQIARQINQPIGGVFVADSGYALEGAGIPRGAIIHEVKGKKISSLDDFEKVLRTIGDGTLLPIRFSLMTQPTAIYLRVLRVDRRWFPTSRCSRDSATHAWECHAVVGPAVEEQPEALEVVPLGSSDEMVSSIAASLVSVTFEMPYAVEALPATRFSGTAVIVDAEQGWAVTDQNTVPTTLGDVRLTFGGSLEIPARVVFLHPQHNLVLLGYDPKLVRGGGFKAAPLVARELTPGEEVNLIGIKSDQSIGVRTADFVSSDPLYLPQGRIARHRDSNIEVMTFSAQPTDFSGVVATGEGEIVGLWVTFGYEEGGTMQERPGGISAEYVSELVRLARTLAPYRSLEAELGSLSLSAARKVGLPEAWIRRFAQQDPRERRALVVQSLNASSPVKGQLRSGDVILRVNGELVTSFFGLERALGLRDRTELLVWSNGEEKSLELAPAQLSGRGLQQVVVWAGMTLHDPHRGMITQRQQEPRGVYVASVANGSPGSAAGVGGGVQLISVNDSPTPNLAALKKVILGLPPGEPVRIRLLAWNEETAVRAIEQNPQFWPSYELRWEGGSWYRSMIGED